MPSVGVVEAFPMLLYAMVVAMLAAPKEVDAASRIVELAVETSQTGIESGRKSDRRCAFGVPTTFQSCQSLAMGAISARVRLLPPCGYKRHGDGGGEAGQGTFLHQTP